MDGLAPAHHVLHAGACVPDGGAPERHWGEKIQSRALPGCCHSPFRKCGGCCGIWSGSDRLRSRRSSTGRPGAGATSSAPANATGASAPRADVNPGCSTSGSFAVRFGICLVPLSGCASGACACRLQSRRANRSARHRIVAAAAGVCRSRQTASAAHSSIARSAQTRFRSRRGCAGAVHRARGA